MQSGDDHPTGAMCVRIGALSPGTRDREAPTDRVLAPDGVNGVGFILSEVFRHLPVALVEEFA